MFNNSLEKNRYSLRKLSVGLASVLIGISFIETNGQTAKADTVDGGNTATISTKVEKTANGSPNTASDANKGTTTPNGSLGAAGSTNAGQESAKENGSQNYNANDSAKATTAKTEAVKGTITAAKAALDAEAGTQKANTPVANQANTDAKDATDEVQNSSAEQQSRGNTVQAANGGASASGNKSATALDTQTLAVNKNSQFAKKVLATNLIETNSSTMTNGGFDEAIWGKLDVNNWQGSVQDGVYQLTSYTGDPSHIIVPNEADFEKAGKSTNGLQVGINCHTAQSLSSQAQTIAFSKTNNQKIKAIGTDWSYAFNAVDLSKFDGSNLDVSSVTNMDHMFNSTSIRDLTSLASWDVSNVTDMSNMFGADSISDLTPLAHWNTSKVTNMSGMFNTTLISDLTPLAHWDTSNVTNMSQMFAFSPDIIDLKPIANWNISIVNTDDGPMGPFIGDTKLNLTNINNTKLMQDFLKAPNTLQGAAFITNNADLVKATINKDLLPITKTAKRIITFDLPHAEPEIITQTIYYKTIAPVQIDYSDPDNPQMGQPFAVKDSDWYLDTSKPNDVTVTVNGKDDPTLASKYQSYDGQAYAKDNSDVEFAAIPIPKIPGYKAQFVQDKANPAMFFVSFIALPDQNYDNNESKDNHDTTSIDPVQPVNPSDDTKPAIDVPITPSDPKDTVPKSPIAAPSAPVEVKDTQDITFDEPVEAPAIQTTDFAWHIKNEATTDTSYTVVNSEYELQLPRFTGYTLRLVKRNAARDAISFVYVNPNKTFKYVFNIKLANGKYILTIGKVSEDGIIPLEKVTFSDYKQLIALITKAVNK